MKAEKNIAQFFKNFIDKEYLKLIQFVRKRIDEGYYNEYAEDIVQDVALNIYNKIDLNTPVENLAGYFYRSLRNRIIDLKRKNKKNVSLEDYSYDDTGENPIIQKLSEENIDKDTTVVEVENDEQLWEAIHQLPAEYREVILATEFEDMTYEQFSDQTKIPIGTLLSRKHRAIAHLTKIKNPKKK